jgi:H2-forming N5,N10-methylenetetrahydromethanopterin dehydrogenase-like enzyme
MDALISIVLLVILVLLLSALLITCFIATEYVMTGKSTIEESLTVTVHAISEKIKKDGIIGLIKAVREEFRKIRESKPQT